ncbi:prenylcysteine oxidase-like [Chelonus insularis]|uniref:prenylcysteine oxidase-like n=1 Tax=Chelonus insularis TaxID=460826 RepID=UPI00158F3C5B|nr:prenylcysteine oxidase-like [Chelonus insularis]
MLTLKFVKYLLFIKLLFMNNFTGAKNCKPKIAIIGGGIGGASTSHFLTKLFKGNLEIDLFEAETIGGRLATVNIDNEEYEAGGSIIHEKNQLMKYFVDFLDLEKKTVDDSSKMGIWNGDKFVFEQSSSEMMTLFKLIYRYGFQPFWLYRLIDSIVDDFGKIYLLHDNGVGFNNVSSLLSAMNNEFPQMLQVSTKDYLKDLGYSPVVIDELIKAVTVVNYGQDTDIHSFVGSVATAGAGSSLWSVKGGNRKVPENLIYRNKKINVISAQVDKISYLRNNGISQYEIFYRDNESSELMNKFYDLVVIATPLTHDHEKLIQFKNLPKNINQEYENEYQTIFVTFVTGKLKLQYFGLVDPIDDILSCNPNNTIINAVARLSTTEGVESNVWKLFSSRILNKEFIHTMFEQVNHVEIKKWKAYPKYSTNIVMNQFKLHDALYYVNAIEWAASAMEMSAIGGRNVAILIHNSYKQTCKNL